MESTSIIIATFELSFRLFKYDSECTFRLKQERKKMDLAQDILLKLHQFESYRLLLCMKSIDGKQNGQSSNFSGQRLGF